MSDQSQGAQRLALQELIDANKAWEGHAYLGRIPEDVHERMANAWEAAIDALSAPAESQGAQPVAETVFVQPVPDHCDRIVWRDRYYHLDTANNPLLVPPPAQPAPDATPQTAPAAAARLSAERLPREWTPAMREKAERWSTMDYTTADLLDAWNDIYDAGAAPVERERPEPVARYLRDTGDAQPMTLAEAEELCKQLGWHGPTIALAAFERGQYAMRAFYEGRPALAAQQESKP